VNEKNSINNIFLPSVIGKGYRDFWNFRGRYRVIKGSRASKKSKTAALNFIYRLVKYPDANLLVIRKTYRTLKDSCFTELKWAISRLKLDEFFKIIESPLEITYLPTGQKIYFRGLDDSLKVTSITVKAGCLCWMWVEEAYEISSENDFNVLDESIRGQVPDGLFKQVTLTFNPWNEHHWLKKRFFDCEKSKSILAKTTNYLINEFLDDADKKLFSDMKKNNIRRYQVAGLGEWGISDGLIYENFLEEAFSVNEIIKNDMKLKPAFGLDFGYTNDPTALFCGLISIENKLIYVFDEMYKKGMSNEAIFEAIEKMGYKKERIIADCSEPKSIDRLRELGLTRVKAARKGADSIRAGIDFISDFKIIIHPKCVNFLTEISNYSWDCDKFGKRINSPVDDFNHLMDAMRYAVEGISKGDTFSF